MLRNSTQHVCLKGLAVILFAAAVSATAAEPQLVVVTNEAQVQPEVLAEAGQVVVRIFEHAGIEVRIQDCSAGPGSPGCDALPQSTLFLRLLPGRPAKNIAKHALGCATTTTEGGDYAWIFMRQVDEVSALAAPLATRAQILGHAIAHEIGHLLAGRDHRPRGLMRANWSRADYVEMSRKLMLIAAPDAARMRAGVKRRAEVTLLATR